MEPLALATNLLALGRACITTAAVALATACGPAVATDETTAADGSMGRQYTIFAACQQESSAIDRYRCMRTGVAEVVEECLPL